MKIEPKVIYEDNHIIVVIKDQNVLSQGDDTGDESLFDAIKTYLKEKYNKPGNVYLGLVHRLDRPTGGVMVFAKTSKAASRLCEQIKTGEFEKSYIAVSVGTFKNKANTLVDYLEKDEGLNVVKVLNFNKPGSKRAELSYKVLEEKQNLSLVDVTLQTGRSHQIRVQLAHAGNPIFGDVKYKGDIKKGFNLALWAYKLTFVHPTTKEKLTFVCLPEISTAPWNLFKNYPSTKF